MANSIDKALFEITPKIQQLAELCEQNNAIDKDLYTKYEVKRGLRDLNGKGVLAGLTNISDVCAKKVVDGVEVPCEGNYTTVGTILKTLFAGFWRRNTSVLRKRHIFFCSEVFQTSRNSAIFTILLSREEHSLRISFGTLL